MITFSTLAMIFIAVAATSAMKRFSERMSGPYHFRGLGRRSATGKLAWPEWRKALLYSQRLRNALLQYFWPACNYPLFKRLCMQMIKIQIADRTDRAKALVEMGKRGRIICLPENTFIVPEPALEL